MLNKIKDILIILTLMLCATLLVILIMPKTKEPTEQTKALCFEYANRNHEKEMTPERWEYLKTIGNPNDTEFFYQSCIAHITGIPATKEYMK